MASRMVSRMVSRGFGVCLARGMREHVKPPGHVAFLRQVVLLVEHDFSSHSAAGESLEITRLEPIGERSSGRRVHHGWTAGRMRLSRLSGFHVRFARPNDLHLRLAWLDAIQRGALSGMLVCCPEHFMGLGLAMYGPMVGRHRFSRRFERGYACDRVLASLGNPFANLLQAGASLATRRGIMSHSSRRRLVGRQPIQFRAARLVRLRR